MPKKQRKSENQRKIEDAKNDKDAVDRGLIIANKVKISSTTRKGYISVQNTSSHHYGFKAVVRDDYDRFLGANPIFFVVGPNESYEQEIEYSEIHEIPDDFSFAYVIFYLKIDENEAVKQQPNKKYPTYLSTPLRKQLQEGSKKCYVVFEKEKAGKDEKKKKEEKKEKEKKEDKKSKEKRSQRLY